MAKKKLNHKYLLHLYSRVDEFLGHENIEEGELPDSIVSFCVVVEKVMKIKLYNKNPFLVFEASHLRENDALSIIALKKDKDIETIKILDVIGRFAIVFKSIFTPDELQALKDIFGVRNGFVHGHKPDDKITFTPEDVVKKMGTIWEKISKISISLFGKENIKNGKPKKKYTEKELEKVLEDEVKKMIRPLADRVGALSITISKGYSSVLFGSGAECPRCGAHSFTLGGSGSDPYSLSYGSVMGGYSSLMSESRPNLYKCSECHLELTEKQYEIAKKLKGS